jgi:hypothetical protein
VGSLVTVALFLLSGATVAPRIATGLGTGPRGGPMDAGSSSLADAEHSLSLGMGPAAGDRMQCSVSAALSSRCLVLPAARTAAQALALNGSLLVHASESPSGGVGPYAYTWAGLPSGCIGTSTSLVSCSPTNAMNYTISVTVSDRSGQNRTASTWVLVSAAPKGGGGSGQGSSGLGGLPLYAALGLVALVIVVVASALRLRRRRSAPEKPGEVSPEGSLDEAAAEDETAPEP